MSDMKGSAFYFFQLITGNITHRPFRSIATVLAFAIISATLFSAQYLTSGAQQSLDAGITLMGADILVVPTEYNKKAETVILMGEPSSFFFKDSGFRDISGIDGVSRASPQIYVATLQGQACCSGEVQIVAIDPKNDFTVATWLKENPGVKMGKDDVIVGGRIIGDIGSDLVFYGHTFHIVGRLGRTGTGVDMSVFTRIEDVDMMADESSVKAARTLTIPQGMVSAVLVKVKPGVSPAYVAEAIRTKVAGTRTITPNGLLGAVTGQLGSVSRLLYWITLSVTAVSIPLLGFISAMVAHERMKEVSILRALGATKKYVIQLMLAESFSVALIGGILGIGATLVIMIFFQDFIATTLKIPLAIPSLTAVLVNGGTALVLCAGIGGIAALYPAHLILRSDPYECIRKGER
jgi:putative ABC transport system permease protein